MEGMLTLELGVEEMLLLSVSLNAPSDCSDICLQTENMGKMRDKKESPAHKPQKEHFPEGRTE